MLAGTNTIALIFDFDITLSPYFQQRKIFEKWGIDENAFWEASTMNCQRGYDLEHGNLKHLIDIAQSDPKYTLSNNDLFEIGKQIDLYDGLSRQNGQRSIFDDLHAITHKPEYRSANIQIECYCISGGLKRMIEGALESHGLSQDFQEVFACILDEDEKGCIHFPMETVGHTIKTQKIFMIAKGAIPSLGAESDDVNEVTEELRIPFEQMIFLGDGQTDIPAFSLINRSGGVSLAVYRQTLDEEGNVDEAVTQKTYAKSHHLAIESKRAMQLLPADYSAGKPLKMALLHYVESLCQKIVSGENE